jgi:Ca-activated chloride channel family protein
MSLLTHLLLVIFLILWAHSSGRSAPEGELRRAGIVLAVESENQETEYLSESDVAEVADDPTDSEQADPATMPPPPLAAALEAPQRPDLPGPEFIESLDANNMANVPGPSKTSFQYELTDEDLKMIEADQKLVRSRIPKGNPATISVFGSGGLTGRSFVFVLDRSKSMGAQGLGVIHAARDELATAISQLEPHHTFQIVGYHHRTVTVSKRSLLPATETNKNLVPEFISNLAAFGSTDHNNGLISALTFNPDVIVLMTDGGYPELSANQLAIIKRMVPRGCQIHCLQFGLGSMRNPANFMTRLAEQNNGTFRYVDVNRWKKDD